MLTRAGAAGPWRWEALLELGGGNPGILGEGFILLSLL